MVKRKISAFFLFFGGVCVFFLSGCGLYGQKLLNETDEQQAILSVTSQSIILALETNSITVLDGVLSESCMEQLDLKKGFLYSCDLIDGEIVEIEQLGCPITSHREGKKVSIKADASFLITTSSGKKYNLYFEYWYKNDFYENKIGVDRIKVSDIDISKSNLKYISGRFYQRSGIYCPDWDDIKE